MLPLLPPGIRRNNNPRGVDPSLRMGGDDDAFQRLHNVCTEINKIIPRGGGISIGPDRRSEKKNESTLLTTREKHSQNLKLIARLISDVIAGAYGLGNTDTEAERKGKEQFQVLTP